MGVFFLIWLTATGLRNYSAAGFPEAVMIGFCKGER